MDANKHKNSGRPLWAPWRIEYILSSKDKECFLCGREKPNNSRKDDFMVVARGDYSFVMLNAFPYNPGHLLISPYQHVGDILAIDKKVLCEMTDLLVKTIKALKKMMNPEGFNVGYNLGLPAGAGLEEHLHMHVVPRWTGDTNYMPVIGKTRVVPQALEDTAEIIKRAINVRGKKCLRK